MDRFEKAPRRIFTVVLEVRTIHTEPLRTDGLKPPLDSRSGRNMWGGNIEAVQTEVLVMYDCNAFEMKNTNRFQLYPTDITNSTNLKLMYTYKY